MDDLNISLPGPYDGSGLHRIGHGSLHGHDVRGQDGSIEDRSPDGSRIHTPKDTLLQSIGRRCCTDRSSHRLLLRLGSSTDCRESHNMMARKALLLLLLWLLLEYLNLLLLQPLLLCPQFGLLMFGPCL